MNHSAMRILAAILAVLAALFLAGCSDDDDGTPEVELDETPPTVVASFPDSGAVNVTRSGPFWIAFSEPMNEDSVQAAFSFSPEPVYFNATWSGDTLIITPSALLEPDSSYAMTVGASAEDEHGNALGADCVIGFTTTAAQDGVPPTVVSTVPTAGAVNVPGAQTIEIVWSEPMDLSVDAQAAITMVPAPAEWEVEWESVTMKIIHSAFPEGQSVTVTIGTQMQDLAGNNLLAPFVLTFTTTNDDTRPTLESAIPANGEIEVAVGLDAILLTFSEPMDPNSFDMTAADVDARINQAMRGEEPTWSTDYSEITVAVMQSLLPGCTYWVNFRNVTDASGNYIDPNPTSYQFTTAGAVSYYPVKNGYEWSFRSVHDDVHLRSTENYTPSSGNFNEVFRDEYDATREFVRLRQDPTTIYHLGRDEYEDGVYQFSMTWDEPLPYIRFPLENYLGDSWTFSTGATLSDTTSMTLTGHIDIDAATVDLVSAELYGTFRGCYVHHLYAEFIMFYETTPVDTGWTHQIMWLAPGVGPVRIVRQDEGGADTLSVYDWNL